MIAGRSGSQKSGLALFWAARMGLPTLYFSADMSPYQASVRLACMAMGETTDEVEAGMAKGGVARKSYLDAVKGIPIVFSFGSPIRWQAVDEEIEAWVELWDSYPSLVVFDNLMDFDGAESDYTEQMSVMSNASGLARDTGSTVMILHHASDKSWEAKTEPWQPPGRDQVKGGLSEKAELAVSVALNPNDMSFRAAITKQRMGFSDPTARTYAVLYAEPSKTRFHAHSEMNR